MKNYKFVLGLNGAPFILIISLILASLVVPMPLEVEANGSTIYVPDDYPTIQDAIDNATAGDTIIVRGGGTYEESIEVDKQLNITGEDMETTIIDAMDDIEAVYITADGVYFSGFTVLNATYDGVSLSSDNTTLRNCVIYDCGDDGVNVIDSVNPMLENFTIHNCGDEGIFIRDCNNATISNTEIYDIPDSGIYVSDSFNVVIDSCDLYQNDRGIYVSGSLNFEMNSCDIHNNTGYESAYLSSSDQATIHDCEVYDNQGFDGLELDYCDNVAILSSRIHDNEGDGMDLDSCDRGRITDCTFYSNEYYGLRVTSCTQIKIDGCDMYNHTSLRGFSFIGSDRCLIKNTESHDNMGGAYISNSDIISICNSTFYNNDENGISSSSSLRIYLADSRFHNNSNSGFDLSESQASFVKSNFTDNYRGIESYKSLLITRYCSFENNTDYGIYADEFGNVNASRCWWGNTTGPYHYSENPTGTGDEVTEWVAFNPWQTELTQPRDLISDLRCQMHELDWNVIYPDRETPKPLGCAAAMVSDWLASAFLTTKLPNYVEGLDTNSSFVNQATGKPVGNTGTAILTFGGQFVNPVVKYSEDDATPQADRAPVKFHEESGVFHFQYANGTDIPGAELPVSVINNDEDMFLIEVFTDGDGRLMMICYGFGWKGTYAAGKFIDSNLIPNLGTFTNGWLIIHWEDANADGFVNEPRKGDAYNLIATGN